MTRPATTTDERTPAHRKSTLFCWECDHENPLNGDWLQRTRDRHLEYVCPVCETTLAKRPLPDEPTTDRQRNRPAVAWRRTVRTTMHVWRASIDVGLSSLAALTARPTGQTRRYRHG